ncbi:Abscisic acid G-protein coupled receptor-domain-containing protein [Pisolithus marmoratus]|nr:Abscisic acid G-protein coupled receptor-domain-containing protein [Pisolithus marmoratus]
MLMCQGFGLLNPQQVSSSSGGTIIVLVPALFSMVLTYRAETPSLFNVRAVTFLLPVAAFVFVLSFIPLPPHLTVAEPPDDNNRSTRCLGSVNGAWSAFARKTSVASPSSIASAEVALERVKSDLRERNRDLDEELPSRRACCPLNSTQPQANETWTSRLTFKRDTRGKKSLAYKQLESQMASRIATLKRHRETAEFSGSSYGDIIAHVLAYLLSLLPQISLALVGVIILSSIRVVFRITSRSMSASLMLLFLSQLMGIYLLSTAVQLRTMFPPSATPDTSTSGLPDAAETNLLSTLPEYTLFGGLFDWSFLAGAAGCALVHWAGGFFDENEMDVY